MKELLEDPETLPFLNGKDINLNCLKKEIDRRIVKIKSMLGQPSNSIRNHPQHCTIECQTDRFPSNTNNDNGLKASDILNSQHSRINFEESKDAKVKYTGRCSLPVSNNRERKKNTNDQAEKNKRVRVSEYLTTVKGKNVSSVKKNLIEMQDEEDSSNQKKFIQTSQDDKIFQSKEFDALSSFKTNENFLDRQLQQQPLPLDLDLQLAEFESQSSEFGNRRESSIGCKTMSMKKVRFTERTAPQYERRILVGDDCIQRMIDSVQKLVSKKRRQALDNKLRQNIFRRIDQKYGQYYDNI